MDLNGIINKVISSLKKENTGKPATVYFIGIGGIGMSALAKYFKSLGAAVFGYDKTQT
ncbi:MAG: Mur ligase domain-containing protein, partial [Chitinophagaceae bacterium]